MKILQNIFKLSSKCESTCTGKIHAYLTYLSKVTEIGWIIFKS